MASLYITPFVTRQEGGTGERAQIENESDFKPEITNLIFYPVESIGFDDFIIYYRFLCKQIR